MPQQTVDLRVDPSDETIRLGPLAVRFLLTGDDSTGTIAAFELAVPAGQRSHRRSDSLRMDPCGTSRAATRTSTSRDAAC